MDIQEAIEALRLEGGVEITGKPRRVAEFFDGIDIAISALQELKLYKDSKLCLIPESVYSKQCTELDAYKQLGTLGEIKNSVEKQIPKSPTYDGDGYAPDGTFVWDEWICPCCGSRFEVEYEEHDYCPNCGQHILWEVEDERLLFIPCKAD